MPGLRLASYNIHNGIGIDGRFDPLRTAAVVAELKADVIALQEVTAAEAPGTSLLARLAELLELRPVPGFVMRRDNGEYGNALLTRVPVTSVASVDLSVPGREPRGAMDVALKVEGHPLRLINTHLGLSPFERRIQGARLLDLVGKDFRSPTALVGDLNGWFLAGGPWGELRRRFQDPHWAPWTFPVQCPVVALDRVWVHPAVIRGPAVVHRTPTSRVASDHFPLVVDLKWPSP